MDQKIFKWAYIILSAFGLMVAAFYVAGKLSLTPVQTTVFAGCSLSAIILSAFLSYKYYVTNWYEFPLLVNISFILNIFSLPVSTILFAVSQVYLIDFMLFKSINDALFVNATMCVSLFFSILWVLTLIYIRVSGYAEE
jgi:hypothetical protein